MQCFLRLLAAIFTALLLMTFYVESQPAYDNAPVALLLPNGTIVMVPGRGKSDAMKTSHDQRANSFLVEASSAGTKLRNKLEKKKVDHQISQPQLQGCIRVGSSGQDTSYFHQQKQTQPLNRISTSVTKSALLDSVEEWVTKPFNNPPQNIIPEAIKISPKDGKQFENVQMCKHNKAFSETDKQDYIHKNSTSVRLNRSDIQFCNRDISAGTRSNMSNVVEKPYGNYLNLNSPARNEMQQVLGIRSFQLKIHEDESNNHVPPRNTLASSNEVLSDACRRRLHNHIGISDRVERDFDFWNSKDLSSNNSNKLKFDTSDRSKQADVQCRNLDIYAGSTFNKCTTEPFHDSNYYHSSAQKEQCYRLTRPRTQEHDTLLYIKKKASNDYITRLKDHSNSNFISERKGNSAGLRLNLLEGERNIVNKIPVKYKKPNLESTEKHSRDVEKQMRRRPGALNEKITTIHNRLEPKELPENDEPTCKYQISRDDKVSNFDYLVHFSRDELETPSQNKYLPCRPIKSAFRDDLHGGRANWLDFKEYNIHMDESFQRADVKKTPSNFCGMLRTNMDGIPKHSCRTPIGTGCAEVLKETKVFPNRSQFQTRQTSSPQTRTERVVDCHHVRNRVHNTLSQTIYHCNSVKAVETKNIAHKWRDRRAYPHLIPDNDNTSSSPENQINAPKRQPPVMFSGNSMYCREKFNGDGLLRGNFENRYSTSVHKAGVNVEAVNRCVTGNSYNEPHKQIRHPIDRMLGLHLITPETGVCYKHQPVYKQQHPFTNKAPKIYQHRMAPMIQFTDSAIVPPHLPVLSHCPPSFAESMPPYGSLQRPLMIMNQYPKCRASKGSCEPSFPGEDFTLRSRKCRTQSTDSLAECNWFPLMFLPLHTSITTDYQGESLFFPFFPLPPQQTSFATFIKDEDDFWRLIHYETIL